MNIIVLKSLIAAGCILAFGVVYWNRNRLEGLSESARSWVLLTAFVLCRLLPFVAVYIVLGNEPSSDVPVFYGAAQKALKGGIVYRDFWSPYSPLFAYVTALPLIIWHSAKAIVLLMIAVEGLAWWYTYRAYRYQTKAATLAAIVYLLLPAPLIFCVIGGQEDVWMWAFGVVSLFLWQGLARQPKPDELWLGVLMAGMLIVTKALAVLIVGALVFWVRRPIRYIAGLLVVGIPGLVVLYALTGTGVLTPLMYIGDRFAPNLVTVLAPLIGNFMPYAGVLSIVGLLIVLGMSVLAAWQLRQSGADYSQALPIIWVVCFGSLMFVHKSSYSNYAFIYMLPLVFTLIDWSNWRHLTFLLVLNGLAPVQPSYWWRLGSPFFTTPTALLKTENLVEYMMEVGIVISIGYFTWLAFRQTGSTPSIAFTKTPIQPRRRVVV